MGIDDIAGTSAEQRADALDAKAERLRARAGRLRDGARGERITATVLNPRSGNGWYILHDLAIPQSKANIDHVVIAPSGVFVVDSKNWSRSPKVGGGTLWVGRFPQRHELATLKWEVEQVNAVLRAALGEGNPEAIGVISLTGDAPRGSTITVDGITALAVENLVGHIAARPTVLNLEHVGLIAHALDRSFESRSGRRSSLVRPTPLPSPAVPAGRVQPVLPVPRSIAMPSRIDRPRRSVPTSSQRPTKRMSKRGLLIELAVPIAVILLGLAGLHELPLFTRALTKVVTPKTALPAVGSTVPSTSIPTPAGISPVWTCLKAEGGWAVSLGWPADDQPNGSWLAQTSPSQSGPWTTKAMGVAPTPIKITGIHSDTVQWFRAGEVIPLELSSKAIMEGQLGTPAGC